MVFSLNLWYEINKLGMNAFGKILRNLTDELGNCIFWMVFIQEDKMIFLVARSARPFAKTSELAAVLGWSTLHGLAVCLIAVAVVSFHDLFDQSASDFVTTD